MNSRKYTGSTESIMQKSYFYAKGGSVASARGTGGSVWEPYGTKQPCSLPEAVCVTFLQLDFHSSPGFLATMTLPGEGPTVKFLTPGVPESYAHISVLAHGPTCCTALFSQFQDTPGENSPARLRKILTVAPEVKPPWGPTRW